MADLRHKEKQLGSPSTGSDDGNEPNEPVGTQAKETEDPDLGDSAHYAPAETLWYHGRLDRYFTNYFNLYI